MSDAFPDPGPLNLLDELPRRRLVAVLVDQADGEDHRLELHAEMGRVGKLLHFWMYVSMQKKDRTRKKKKGGRGRRGKRDNPGVNPRDDEQGGGHFYCKEYSMLANGVRSRSLNARAELHGRQG